MTNRKGAEHVTWQRTFLGLVISEVDKIMEAWFHFCSIKEMYVPKTTGKLNQFLVGNKGIVDRISRLPNEILSKILSYLPLKEAARSSILSNRWRYLWRTISNLHFDIVNNKDTTFVSWVDQILKNYNGLELESFRIKHSSGNGCCSSYIDRWIRFAIEKQVGILELHLLASPNYCFPCWLFNKRGGSLKHLSLANCVLKRHPEFSNFKSLVSLCLREIDVSCVHLARVLSDCIALKWLTLARCNMSSPLVVSIASSSLKHLSFFCCFNLEEIEIDAVELVSLELRGTRPALRFKHSNNNNVVRFAYRPARDDDIDAVDYAFGALPIDLPLLRTLFLSSPPLKANSIPANKSSTFMNLRRLVLAITKTKPESLIPLISSLLEATPFLHKLELHLSLSSSGLGATGELTRQNTSKFTHNYLKIVEIYGFYGHNVELEMAIYLLNYAVYLETMVLNSTMRWYGGNGEFMILKGRNTIIPGRHIRELLAKQAPSFCNARLRVL